MSAASSPLGVALDSGRDAPTELRDIVLESRGTDHNPKDEEGEIKQRGDREFCVGLSLLCVRVDARARCIPIAVCITIMPPDASVRAHILNWATMQDNLLR